MVYIRLQTISQEIVQKKMGEIERTHETKLALLRENKARRAPQRQVLDR